MNPHRSLLMQSIRGLQEWLSNQPQSELDEMTIHIHPDDMEEAVTYDWFAKHVKAFDGLLFGVPYIETWRSTRGRPRVSTRIHKRDGCSQ